MPVSNQIWAHAHSNQSLAMRWDHMLVSETYGFVEKAITLDSQQGPISEEERAEMVERQPTKSNY